MVSALLLISFIINKKSVESSNLETTKISLEDDYRIYDKIIREAWAFHKPNYDYPNTFKTYRKAFNSVSSPLAIDVFDALRIAIEVDSVDAMFEFSETLVKKSCDKRFFEGERLKKLKNHPERWSKLMAFIDEVQANPHQYWDVELKEKFEALYRKDQEIAKKYNNGRSKYGFSWMLETEYHEEVKIPFMNLIKKYGLKGEKELGVYVPDEYSSDALPSMAFPVVIILHIVEGGENRFTPKEIDEYYTKGYIPKILSNVIKDNLK